MKRILHIVTQMEGGGAQRCAIEAARLFREWGKDSGVIFLFRRRGVYDHEPNVTCLWPEDPKSPIDYIKIIWILFVTLRQQRPDAIMTHSHYANVIGCFIGWLAGVPVRNACQTGLPDRLAKPARFLDWIWGVIGIYHKIVINSKTNKTAFEQCRPESYRKRMIVVANGIKPIKPCDNKAQGLSDFNILPDNFIIATIGRLDNVKNYSRLLEALAALSNTHLMMAGDGPLKSELEQLSIRLKINNRVTFLGDQREDGLSRLLGYADVFVHPSLWESFGLVPLEAGCAGLPLCVSDIPAHHEILGESEEGNALFFDPENSQDIAAKLQTLAKDPQLRSDLGQSAKKRAMRYSLDAMAKGYLDALQ